jgi:DNA-binding response OmpR family regulator
MIKDSAKILVVEDEQHIALGLKLHLEKEGHVVILAKDGHEGLEKWRSTAPDLIVLDIMMPKVDGLKVLEQIREHSPMIPILILSARDSTFDKIKALKNGVDDYLAKPFDAEELLLRIERLLLKKKWQEDAPLSQVDAVNKDMSVKINSRLIDFKNAQLVGVTGETIQLTDQEIKLLKVFIDHPNTALSRKDLLKKAWGYQEEIETRTLDNFIVRFRKYFETNPKKPEIFKSLRSIGYMFVADEKNKD